MAAGERRRGTRALSSRQGVTCDLLIKGGDVLDPARALDGPLDIAIAGGRIAALESDISPDRARRTIEVRGASRRILPGLIDVHTHVAYGATTRGVGLDCCEPDQVGVLSGVTTVVDTRSVGQTNIEVFYAHIRPRSRTRIIRLGKSTCVAPTTQLSAAQRT